MSDIKSIRFPPPVADDMVRAILEGRKTVTRRVAKPQPTMYGFLETHWDWKGIKPPYRPNDILYVKERVAYLFGRYAYRADYDEVTEESKPFWKPSIHMPKEAARLFLRVKEVRVERLQEIKLLGILREGVHVLSKLKEYGYEVSEDDIGRLEFKQRWDSTIKKADLTRYGWAANPWVWVIGFERISREEAM